MIVLIVNFQVKKDEVDAFLATITPLIDESQKEIGCLEYDLYKNDQEECFTLLEKWKDQDALNFHNNTEHFKTYAPKLGDFCENVSMNRLVPTE